MAPNGLKIEAHRLRVVPIHKYPEYLKPCCTIINEEWPRNETARMHSLKSSCDEMPTSLILVLDDEVIGHSKLTPIPSMADSCFLESVVIKKDMRGLNLGKHLMAEVEEYCKNILQITSIHLSTIDKELFYEKLGYAECEPVSIYGGYNRIYLPGSSNTNTQSKPKTVIKGNSSSESKPPPPPPMPILAPEKCLKSKKHGKVFMIKRLN